VIAPDLRGYNRSDKPAGREAYTGDAFARDALGLLDALGIERAVFVGHDWGGIVTWMMALLHPARTAAVVGVNTPYFPRPAAPPLGLMRQIYGDNYYIVKFQERGVTDAALARDVRRVFTQLMRRGVPQAEHRARIAAATGRGMRNMVELIEEGAIPGEPLLTPDELQVYVDAFTRTGFTGGLNWYRNLDRNWETTPQIAGARIPVPALMVTAEYDAVLRPERAATMKELVPDLEMVMIPGCGHWTQQEKPAELNRILVDWLSRRCR